MLETVKCIKTALILLFLLTVLTGLIYPVTVTALAQLLFPYRANGSIITREGKKIGSELIGQLFTDPKYFWGRPSATQPFPCNALSSSGSNLGPLSTGLLEQIKIRSENLRAYHILSDNIPVDLVAASGSGLDPEISPYAAFFQVQRIAKIRGIAEDRIRMLIEAKIKYRLFGILGEPRINVLQLNLALDDLSQTSIRNE